MNVELARHRGAAVEHRLRPIPSVSERRADLERLKGASRRYRTPLAPREPLRRRVADGDVEHGAFLGAYDLERKMNRIAGGEPFRGAAAADLPFGIEAEPEADLIDLARAGGAFVATRDLGRLRAGEQQSEAEPRQREDDDAPFHGAAGVR